MSEWRDIPGYENYSVSSDGRVYSKRRCIELKQTVSRFGYPRVVVANSNGRYTAPVHRLVAMAFLPNPKSLPQVNHINEVKTDNRVENLEWCSCAYNINYGHRNETVSRKLKAVKEATTARPVEQVDLDTGKVVKTWKSMREAARNFGIGHQNIRSCCIGERKRMKGYGWRYAS